MTAPVPGTLLGIREADIADPREAARIDAFVRERPGSTPFHLTGWSRAVQRGCRQRARYLIDERADGSLAGVLPLTEIRSRLFGRALVSAGFATSGGPLGEGGEELAAGAWAIARRLGCGVELRGGLPPEGWAVDDTTYVRFTRPIAVDDTAELASLPRRQRAGVRHALAADLEVRTGRGAADVAGHHRVYAESVRNLGTPVFPVALMREVIAELDADVLTVVGEGRPVASALNLYHQGAIYPYWGGGTASARGMRATDRLYFALMSHARARGCTLFDFGRSKTGTGAATFKRNWGFVPEPLRYARRDNGIGRSINPQDPRYGRKVALWKKLPLPVANAVGPWIARGLG